MGADIDGIDGLTAGEGIDGIDGRIAAADIDGMDGLTTGAGRAKSSAGVGRVICGVTGEGAYEYGRGVDGTTGEEGGITGVARCTGAAAGESGRDI